MNDLPSGGRRVRVGIDVGGTFTDVVAIDAATREPIARVKVPTTHDAPEGVAAGIVTGIERLLRESTLAVGEVAFIAHSTTQATNALLEGDVAPVGVVGLLRGSAWFARRCLRFGPVGLAPGRVLDPEFAFVRAKDEAGIRGAVDRLIASGARAIAASEAFGVDRPGAETLRPLTLANAASTPPAVTTSVRPMGCARAPERQRSTRRCCRGWSARRG